MTNLIQTLISGLSLGSIYALIALGYTMVYGIAKMLNFAHGDVIMVGAYSGIVAVAQMGLSPWVTVIVSIVVCAVLGVVIEFCAYKPLRQAAPLSVLITAIGVSYLLQNAALLIFGSQQMAYPKLVTLGSFTVGGVQVDGITVLTLAVTAVLMVALTLFTWVCFGLLYVSSFIFGLASTVVALLGIAVLVTYSPQNGVILLVIAFLVSPLGLPMAAAWLVGKVQDLRFAIQDAVYG